MAVELSGTLLGFDGEFYRVETDYGELTVDNATSCAGPGCPNLADFVAEVRRQAPPPWGQCWCPR